MGERPAIKTKSKTSLRSLRLSLKYRPDIWKLILKMRLCIQRKNTLLKTLKHQLKNFDEKAKEELDKDQSPDVTKEFKDSSTQTNPKNENAENKIDTVKEDAGWNLMQNGESEKSIADQVKEAAQSALQDRGMVYVESAGMYYDYKTGYYYNSELGLYYHTDTGCYYHYSDNQFVFHSYPDMSKVNSALVAHQKKKERKLKRDEEGLSKPKKARRSKKKDGKKKKKNTSKINSVEAHAELSDKVNDSNKDQDGIEDDLSKEVNAVKSEDIFQNILEADNSSKMIKNNTSVEKNSESNEGEIAENKLIESENKELEDGECSETGSEDCDESDAESESSQASTATVSDEDSVAKQYPPCMRVIVRETKLPKLKVGSLFLITKDGGTIGREGEKHAILLRDQNVSRTHLDIKYDLAKNTYTATDLGSKNGTILNGTRMSESQELSLPLVVLHGSVLQLGETKLLCHIHPGNSTCGQCEPGLLMQAEEEKKVAYTRTVSVKKQHELELARLKNIYAPQRLAIEEKPYNDRAQARREAVGSTNHAEKTQATDLNTSIASDNKGFKLLQKMGWSQGEGLGKDNQGDTEPVPLVSNEGKSGLGNDGAVAPPSNTPKPRVNKLASGAMRLASRTKMLQPPAKAFQNTLDEDEESE